MLPQKGIQRKLPEGPQGSTDGPHPDHQDGVRGGSPCTPAHGRRTAQLARVSPRGPPSPGPEPLGLIESEKRRLGGPVRGGGGVLSERRFGAH